MKRALLIHPEFSPYGFWNYKEVCRLIGAKYPAAPLGLITLAALLPQDWQIRLVDLNTTALHDSDIDWSELVFIGGMLPQQAGFLRLIERVHRLGRKVVAGGPDPTSQPWVYKDADHLVLGEGEGTVPLFLRDLEAGRAKGIYQPEGPRPDITRSPIPRFDLLKLDDYLMIGVQLTRGCPFTCEFCDIIELYGRSPRSKTPAQVVAELDALYALGYRRHVDFVDDNFIGNKRWLKETLRAIKRWSASRRHPFYFSTEASIDLADDPEILALMRGLDFRYVFVGIESPDERVLRATKKRQNLHRELFRDLRRIGAHGMVVNGGFIVGFDNETRESARSIADHVEQSKISMAMVGLLHALPNTQLTRRLRGENRFVEDSNRLPDPESVDQTVMGLNFATLRPKSEIIEDYLYVIGRVYAARSYFGRCLQQALSLRPHQVHRPSMAEALKMLRAFAKVTLRLGLIPPASFYFWRNILIVSAVRPASLEMVVNLMGMYIHFQMLPEYIGQRMRRRMAALRSGGT